MNYQNVILIGEPSYIISRGLAELIQDYSSAEIIFFENIFDVIHYIKHYTPFYIFINPSLYEDHKNETRIFFDNTRVENRIALVNNSTEHFANKNKFSHILEIDKQKEQITKTLEIIFSATPQQSSGKEILSDREVEVLRLIAMGYTNKNIGDKLFISTHTVISHRKNITAKLGIRTVSGLTVYAVLNKLVPRDQIK